MQIERTSDGAVDVRDQLIQLVEILEDEFGQVLDLTSIRREAAGALAELGDARLTEFVPILAWRRARARLRALGVRSVGHGVAGAFASGRPSGRGAG